MWLYHFAFTPAMWVSGTQHLHHTCGCYSLHFSPSDRCAERPLMVSSYISLMANNSEHIFMHFLNYLFRYFACVILPGWLSLLLRSFMYPGYKFHMKHIILKYFFTLCVLFFFHFIIFQRVKILNLMMLLIFHFMIHNLGPKKPLPNSM